MAGAPFCVDHGPGLIKAILLDEHEKFDKLLQIRVLGPLLGRAF
jgi:hypothetical protein